MPVMQTNTDDRSVALGALHPSMKINTTVCVNSIYRYMYSELLSMRTSSKCMRKCMFL